MRGLTQRGQKAYKEMRIYEKTNEEQTGRVVGEVIFHVASVGKRPMVGQRPASPDLDCHVNSFSNDSPKLPGRVTRKEQYESNESQS